MKIHPALGAKEGVKKMAVASLVLGILSLVFSFFSVWVSLVLGIVGIILGEVIN